MNKRKLMLSLLAFSFSFSPMLFPDGIQSKAMASTAYDNLVLNSPETIQKIEAVDSSFLSGTNKIETFVNDFSNMVKSGDPVTEQNLHDKFYNTAINMMFSSNANDRRVASDVALAFHIGANSTSFPTDLLPLKDAIKAQLLGSSDTTGVSGGGGAPIVAPSTSSDSAVLATALKIAANQHVKVALDAATRDFAFSLSQLDTMKSGGQILDLSIQGVQFEIPAQAIDLAQVNTSTSAQLQLSVQKAPDSDSLKSFARNTVIGDIYEFTASVINKDGTKKNIEPFSGQIKASLPISKDYKGDPSTLKVFRYNEQTKNWDLIGGTYDNITGTVIFTTNHFSKYTLMEVKTETALPFSDISGHWAEKDIRTLYAKGIAKGSNGKALPDAKVTRAEFASFLVQLLGLPKSANTLSFHDVDNSAWYYSNLAAAFDAGLMSGYNKGQIGPNDFISREQMATMMINALKYKGINIENTPTVQFKDRDQIHGWALNSVTTANAMGIAKGLKDGSFDPRGFATRAEAMTMMARLLEKL